jgi:RHS repeat-associated protein
MASERDSETGLDFAQVRYNSSAQGRFTSPDSLLGTIGNPQTLNRYAYVANNPLKFTDPTGHEMYSATTHGPERGVHGDTTNHIFCEFVIPQCFPTPVVHFEESQPFKLTASRSAHHDRR